MRILTPALLGVLLIFCAVLWAQETADICLGGGLVARLRERGPFASVAERAAHVDKKIVEIVSTKDTLHPQVSVKQQNNRWTVYAWDIAVLTVYPAEAKANGLSEKALAEMWARNLRQQLPKATPCSKLPPEMLGYGKNPASGARTTTPSFAAVQAPGTAASRAQTVRTSTPAPPAQAAAQKPAAPVSAPEKPKTAPAAATAANAPAASLPKPPSAAQPAAFTGTESGALLLIVDAMRAAREMNDEEWAARKEACAKELYAHLVRYLTGQAPVATSKPKETPAATKPMPVEKPAVPAQPSAAPAAVPPAPAAKPPATSAKPPVPASPAKPAAAPKPAPATPGEAVSKPPAPAAAADPSMAKVPQKNRIRAKFAAAKPVYDKLAASDPEAAKPVAEKLAASRKAFAAGNFDEAEKYVDEALGALGVIFKE